MPTCLLPTAGVLPRSGNYIIIGVPRLDCKGSCVDSVACSCCLVQLCLPGDAVAPYRPNACPKPSRRPNAQIAIWPVQGTDSLPRDDALNIDHQKDNADGFERDSESRRQMPTEVSSKGPARRQGVEYFSMSQARSRAACKEVESGFAKGVSGRKASCLGGAGHHVE